MKCAKKLSIEELQRLATILRLLAHPHRLQLIEILEKGPAPVHALVDALGLPQGAVSLHLNQMRRVGLLSAQRQGREVWYRIADPSSLVILDCVRKKKGGRS